MFSALHAEAVANYCSGCRDVSSILCATSLAMLRASGLTPEIIRDYAEDFSRSGSPTLEDFIGVAEIRQAEFLGKWNARWPAGPVLEMHLPPKSAEWEGIAWLPRITAKARCFLEGSLPPEIMYGCAGDRGFLNERGLSLPGFLAAVRDADGDDQSVIRHVQEQAR